MKLRHFVAAVAIAASPLLASCDRDPSPLAEGQFAFGVIGDAPYTGIEERLFDVLVGDLQQERLAWIIHIGDILRLPCSDSMFLSRREKLRSIGHPIVYTPGDNEWTDCHADDAGGYRPLERLSRLREIFFTDAEAGLTGDLRLASQADDAAWSEFVENTRWHHAGIVFATFHLVGSRNGLNRFSARTAEDDAAVRRRTVAAAAWLRQTFAVANERQSRAVVLALHADPDFEGERPGSRAHYDPFLAALEEEAARFGRTILLLHGDTHLLRMDRPLVNRATGDTIRNLNRVETFGSPDVGWIRVVVDTLEEPLFRFEADRVSWLELLRR